MKRNIEHWILIGGKPLATTKTRKQMRLKIAKYRKPNTNIRRQEGCFYYAGKVLINGDIVIVNCRKGL